MNVRLLGFAFATGLVAAISASSAQASCRQEFSHTTCSGWGPMQKCTNHFKQVCTKAAPKPIAIAPPRMVTPPPTVGRVNGGGRLVTDNGAGIIANNGSRVIGNNGANVIGQNGANLNRGGNLIQDGGAYMRPR